MSKILLGIFLSASLAGCTGLVTHGAAPTDVSGMAPAVVQKEDAYDSASGDVPADIISGGGSASVPPSSSAPPPVYAPSAEKNPVFAAADPKPHPGGVSALPADVDGGDESKQPIFDFTYTGAAEPVCKTSSGSGGAIVRYQVSGVVGAVLMDGTRVPVTSGCEDLFVRFHRVVSKNTIDCQDVRLTEDCQFNGTVTVPDAIRPMTYIVYYGSSTDCGKLGNINTRRRMSEMIFADEMDNLPSCAGLNVYEGLWNKSKMETAAPNIMKHP